MLNTNKTILNEYKLASEPEKSTLSKSLKVLLLIILTLLIAIKEAILSLIFKKKPENISNKCVLVTGAANGLGRAISMRFAQEGCDIAICDIDYKGALQTAEEIREKFNVNCKAFHCDISDHSEILKLKVNIENEMRPVDILVNNAGLLYMSEFVKSDVKDIKKVIDVNLVAQINMTHTFLPSMVERKCGRIVTMSSCAGLVSFPSVVIYSSTKSGLIGFMNCLSDEFLVNNIDFIKFTTICPDFTNTRKELSDALDKFEFKLPRLTPERVADEAVRGVMRNKSRIIVSNGAFMMLIIPLLPAKARKFFFSSTLNIKQMFDSNK